MVPQADSSTDRLLNRAPAGDRVALAELSARHRDRQRQMASVGMEHPFHPWVHQVVRNRLSDPCCFHVQSTRRAMGCEERFAPNLSDESVMVLARKKSEPPNDFHRLTQAYRGPANVVPQADPASVWFGQRTPNNLNP